LIYKIIDIKKQKSKYGGVIKVIYLKDENGDIWKTYLDEKNHNYDKWIHTFDRIGEYITNLKILNKEKKLINADSFPVLVNKQNCLL